VLGRLVLVRGREGVSSNSSKIMCLGFSFGRKRWRSGDMRLYSAQISMICDGR